MEVRIGPARSTCRSAVSLPDAEGAEGAEGAECTVLRYPEDVPGPDEIREVLERPGREPWDITRTREAAAEELGLGRCPRDDGSRERWIAALCEHPRPIRRPIVTAEDGTAVVARTDEAVRGVLSR